MVCTENYYGYFFSTVGRQAKKLSRDRFVPIASDDFISTVARLANEPVTSGGEIEILNNGDEFYPKLLHDIRSAKIAISMTVYIWEPGRTSSEIFKALTEKARDGLAVRVLVDGLGGFKAPEESIKIFTDAGGKFARFRTPRFGRLMRYYKRTHMRAISHHYYKELLEGGVKIFEYSPTMIHTKALVVEGEWAVIGSANMDSRSAYLNQENIIGIRDTDFASKMEKVFAEDLAHSKEIDSKKWAQRNILSRITETCCSVLNSQY
jgi:phosphatidylserine/phosphatidylglycerophosphate/cardiolipin synthase-like enzyme